MSLNVPLAKPSFGPEEAAALSEVLASGWVSQGPKVEQFENRLAELIHCGSVTAVNSGTSALMLILRALDISPGDSIVIPAFGCAATALPVLEVGAKPLFADIDPATFNISWETISRVLDKNTRAVIVVHMFGRIADMETIATECKRRNLLLVEDAALALGARHGGRFAGTFGVAGCFSFHPRKILTTGEGGAVSTDDSSLAARVRAARNYGAAQTAWARFQTGDGSPRGFSRLGFNCKLTDLQAAIGLVQIERLPLFLARRVDIAVRYFNGLRDSGCLTLPSSPAEPDEHVFQAYVCTWTPENFEAMALDHSRLLAAEASLKSLKKALANALVAVSDAAQFLPELPVFGREDLRSECPNAFAASRLAFAIPIFPSMTEAQIARVIESLRAASAI
jgi:perosamine synthetase